jgi:hypothetical protein
MEKYVTCLLTLVPNANISYTGIDVAYEDIEWLDERPQPSKAECDNAWPEIQYDIEYANVERARLEAYQNTADPLFFGWQRDENTEQEWIDAVQAVKHNNLYPAPPTI